MYLWETVMGNCYEIHAHTQTHTHTVYLCQQHCDHPGWHSSWTRGTNESPRCLLLLLLHDSKFLWIAGPCANFTSVSIVYLNVKVKVCPY